jgi:hypothetical protein
MERITARELLTSGACSGQCMTGATESVDTCTCVCGGAYHGSLADSLVESSTSGRDWWELCGRGGWSLRLRNESSTLIASPSVHDFNRAYRSQTDTFGYFRATIRNGPKDFEVKWDFPCPRVLRNDFDRNAYAAFNKFARDLLRKRRIRLCFPAWGNYGSLVGFRSQDEALTAECLAGESFAGNPCGTVRAVWALAGYDLDQMYAAGGHPELARFPDACPVCRSFALYDAVDDLFICPSSDACQLAIRRGEVQLA